MTCQLGWGRLQLSLSRSHLGLPTRNGLELALARVCRRRFLRGFTLLAVACRQNSSSTLRARASWRGSSSGCTCRQGPSYETWHCLCRGHCQAWLLGVHLWPDPLFLREQSPLSGKAGQADEQAHLQP